ncbi:tetratricopeptide repeat protein [Streptomyces parvus]|uniref:tetratricopeptide repeat protein n=1 Tax=Streptomyces parvus TaxID=66428 RepID=UPI003716CF8F
MGHLARTLGALGWHTEALPLRERALAITEAALGPDHPTTILYRDYLSDVRQMPTGDNDAP